MMARGTKKTRWDIEMDNGEPYYSCPKCGSRMVKKEYDRAVGTEGYNFCPYCGEDLRCDHD